MTVLSITAGPHRFRARLEEERAPRTCAAFAGMLSAGLVRSTKHIASGGWVASVVGHTWIAFAIVLVCAVAFAVVAQRHVPEARTLLDVLRAL